MDKQLLRILSSELEPAGTDDSDDDSVIRRNEDDLATDFLFRDSYIDDRDLGRDRRIVQYGTVHCTAEEDNTFKSLFYF